MSFTDINPKIILTNSLTTGRRFVKKQNLNGVNIFNFAIYTPESFIKEKLIRLLPNYRLISNDECAYILLSLIENNDYGLKKYVTSFGAASKLLEVINDYRYNSNDKFTNLIKADYPNLLKDYKKELDDNRFTDCIFALNLLKDEKQKEECFVLSDLTLRPLEKEVFSSIFNQISYIDEQGKDYQVVEVFDCYGQYNEVTNVLDYISENNIPIGDVEVIYSDSIYENIIKGLCSARNVPYTLKSNHARSSNYVSFIYDILNYFKNDYKFELLENILSNHGLDVIYLNEFYSTLNFPIYVVGFSKERSLDFINEYNNDPVKQAEIPNFLKFFNDVLEITNHGFDYSLLLKVAKKYIKAIDEVDTLSSLVSRFENLVNLEKDDNKKINLIMNLLNRLTYSEGDNDQKLSFSLVNKSFTLRKCVFVLGVNQTLLVGSDVENAFINDVDKYKEELKEDKHIHISDYQRLIKVDNLKYYLSRSDASIYLSFSSFDKIELKEMTDGVRLLTDKTDYIKKNCYKEQKDKVTFKNNLKINNEKPLSQYNNGEINPVEEALDEEKEPLVISSPVVVAPQPFFKLSPSAVGNLIKCPFLFYYQSLLKAPTVEFPELDEASWLEANTRGTLFHEIMERYFKNFINQTSVYFDQKLFDKAFKQSVNEAEKINPVNNTYIHDRELEDLKELSKNYINSIVDIFDTYHVLATEYNLAKLNYHYPKNNNLILNGVVDRIDGYVDNGVLHLRVVDYKSGKEKKKGEHSYYQHVLYTYILKEGLTQFLSQGKYEFDLQYSSVVVDEFDYVFITADSPLQYGESEFDNTSPDYQKVFNAIDGIVLKYLDNEANFIELLDDVFMKTYPSFKERQKEPHDMCAYCSYQKECLKRLQWGAKEWQKAK